MLIRALVTLLLIGAVSMPADADQGKVSDWLVRGHDELVDTVSAARLAMLCQRWPLKPDRATFIRAMRDRTGVLAPADRDFVAQAISDGEAQATSGYVIATRSVCMSIAPTQLAAAAAYVTGRAGLRSLVHDH
ncbi:hypothetical protein [Acidisphaera sp. L21]|jgi:hypothetical protein|uniref:hypothetical protein n=1 Tax=Acidisphaera sp. L21 TaxID=1641851 RepID=UPI00131CECD9|nr:hypothetical protein [Acidisphaera sp. L21]